MRNAGFTIVELMVSLAVVLLVVAGTTAVITYQSGLSAYHIKAANAHQAVETALLLMRNDLLQAGGPTGAMWKTVNNNKGLFIKYSGFTNFEDPQLSKTTIENASFTIDNFPLLAMYNIPDKKTAFLGALYVYMIDEKCYVEADPLKEVTETTPTSDYITHKLKFTPYSSLPTDTVEASPAIVYEFVKGGTNSPGTLLRNGLEILGGNNSDISVTSFSADKPSETTPPTILSWSVYIEYDWTPPSSSASPVTKSGFKKIQAKQSISVGQVRCLMRIGG